MNDTTEPDRRRGADRRRHATRLWDILLLRGRRREKLRRVVERQRPHLVERFSSASFCLIMILIGCTIADGVLTLQLMDGRCAEANPIMAYLLQRGTGPFLFGKYAMTVAGLPVLLIFKNHSLFGSRFRVGYLIPVFVVLYVALLAYQVTLFRSLFA